MERNETISVVIAMLLVALVLLSPVACTINRQNVIAQAIKDGADPIAAKCAIDGDARSAVCVLVARKTKSP